MGYLRIILSIASKDSQTWYQKHANFECINIKKWYQVVICDGKIPKYSHPKLSQSKNNYNKALKYIRNIKLNKCLEIIAKHLKDDFKFIVNYYNNKTYYDPYIKHLYVLYHSNYHTLQQQKRTRPSFHFNNDKFDDNSDISSIDLKHTYVSSDSSDDNDNDNDNSNDENS